MYAYRLGAGTMALAMAQNMKNVSVRKTISDFDVNTKVGILIISKFL